MIEQLISSEFFVEIDEALMEILSDLVSTDDGISELFTQLVQHSAEGLQAGLSGHCSGDAIRLIAAANASRALLCGMLIQNHLNLDASITLPLICKRLASISLTSVAQH